MDVYKELERLVKYGAKKELFQEEDKIYIRNSLIALFKLDEYKEVETEDEDLDSPTEILDNLLNYALEQGILEWNTSVYRDLLDTKIMGLLMPRPSEVSREFNLRYKEDKKEATDYFYNLSKACDYVRVDRIAKNITWKAETEYGDLDITINLSKPEKDPKAIAAAKNLKASSYPSCLLCKENVGYSGRLNHPARQNLRVIGINLKNENWYMQYSPYSYYNEHCIILSGKHEPMVINRDTFDRSLEFVQKFPHYFAGSNADLPIVGGSILSHDHYQGGRYTFAMDKAKSVKEFSIEGYEDISLSIIKWPLTVIRMNSKDRNRLSELGEKILNHWRGYSDDKVSVLAFSGETPHNTITPIIRRRGELFELDLVLRNNRTSKEHPDGIFHPHEELHHIKKENIGLIEVLGLAVLPARLKDEIEEIKDYILNKGKYKENISNTLKIHLDWIKEIEDKNEFTAENIDSLLKKEVGEVFSKVLEHCGVFKWDNEGREALDRYISKLKKEI
ncbi:UDP-glucose--hexose-1-phosphate uridylyltransferase [uncultured Clostridium sp.]|uniref:UDP-glucose--hexose-1-phosphate uridylyltransferase n=1 Tax=uncultured Clostridium sp. TaxID=59620 RepID=UPI00263278A0|nr:UDP-glucose--hexose-1-phosphate uridylyltransferase [uncultured Clostridium sp.]